ncbi:Uncharacterised protein [Kingella potus]|uniref:Uncharacterized protein n=1 Tax=Kingella potus TaxID=265175 RepID=A0A377QYM6_9NEIS|nr:hypothetical protein [Kingella potus]UOP00842.1 hypothetical protein LVJ84_14075 [Kingella potus]STR00484.1 Uncharacterised protein [Kingella potus]
MKPYFKFIIMYTFVLPLLAPALLFLFDRSSGSTFIAGIFILLWLYSIPAVVLLLIIAIKFKWQRNWRGIGKTVATAALLAIASVVIGEMISGDGFVEWGLTLWLALAYAAMTLVASCFLPKPGTMDSEQPFNV